jgi:hypothetical protein
MKTIVIMPVDVLLLFAKFAVFLASDNVQCDDPDSKLTQLAREIIDAMKGSSRDAFLKQLACDSRSRLDDPKGFLYHKITTGIKKLGRKEPFAIRSGSTAEKQFKDIIQPRFPGHKKINSGFKMFCEEYLASFVSSSSPEGLNVSQYGKREIEESLRNTTWYLYYHEYETTTPYSVISRLVLHIADVNHITLFDRGKEDDFEGTGVVSIGTTSAILVIHLKRKSIPPKELELRTVLSKPSSEHSILLGQYMDFETADEIVSGTFILENTKGHREISDPHSAFRSRSGNFIERDVEVPNGEKAKVVEVDLVYSSGWEEFIPRQTAMYLMHKWKNFTKTRPGVTNLKQLGLFLKKQEDKKYREFKFNTEIEFDLFIVTPIGRPQSPGEGTVYGDISKWFFKYPDPGKFEQNTPDREAAIYQASDVLKEMGLGKIYYPRRKALLQKSGLYGNLDPHMMLEENIAAMRKSRFVMLILQEQSCGSALIEIGWAIQMEKPVFIVPLKKNILPKLLSKTYQDKIIVIEGSRKIKNIPELLKAYHAMILSS